MRKLIVITLAVGLLAWLLGRPDPDRCVICPIKKPAGVVMHSASAQDYNGVWRLWVR